MKRKIIFAAIMVMMLYALPVFAAALPYPDKTQDKELQAMIEETLPKFQTMTYSDKDFEIPCNVFLPDDYPGDGQYPLVIFIADGSVVGKGADAPLRQGYGGIIWATKKEQAEKKCIVVVPQYPKLILDDHSGYTITNYIKNTENLVRALIAGFRVDPNRVYATGQSMGCMTFLVMAAKNPDLFAAEIFVGGQWDVRALDGLKGQKFFYIVAEGDQRASTGQNALKSLFRNSRIPFSSAIGWDAKMSQADFTKAMNTVLMGNTLANFVQFRSGTVLPAGVPVGTEEHMFSFDYAYKIDALRDWLFRQSKKDRHVR